MKRFAIVLSIGLAGLVLAACVPPPTSTPPESTVDQSLAGDPEFGLAAFAAAQTFTAGRTGTLDKISLHSLQSGNVPVEISIQNLTETGAPNGTPIAAATVLAPPFLHSGLTDIPLATPVPVTAGVKYALVVDWVDGTGGLNGMLGDQYASGELWYYQSNTSWAQLGLVAGEVPDLIFQTWVN